MTRTIAVFALLLGCGLAQKDAKDSAKNKEPQTSQESRISGKLIDADCYSQAKCRVGSGTTHFGLILPDSTFLKFDEGGSAKVLDALKSSKKGKKLLSAKPGAAKRITVGVTGTRTGDTYNLESIHF